jgi:hypothetical protein
MASLLVKAIMGRVRKYARECCGSQVKVQEIYISSRGIQARVTNLLNKNHETAYVVLNIPEDIVS